MHYVMHMYIYIYIYIHIIHINADMYVCLCVCMYMPLFSSAYMEDRVLKINHGACNMVTFLFALHGGAGRSRANQAESDRGGISCYDMDRNGAPRYPKFLEIGDPWNLFSC